MMTEEEEEEILTSDRILFYVQSLNNPKIRYIKTDFIKSRDKTRNPTIIHMSPSWRPSDIIPTNQLTIDLKEVEVLITGHSDYEINEDELDLLEELLPNLKIWICQNKNIRHTKLISIPIGITNATEPGSQIHQILGNTLHIMQILKTPKQIKNLAYLNISSNTYPKERTQVINLYKDKPWVTYAPPIMSHEGHYEFLENIYRHKFVFAPRGNGIDTHRMWEALYLRTIPIVRYCVGMEDFKDLPILFVKEWDDEWLNNEDYLQSKYDEIMMKWIKEEENTQSKTSSSKFITLSRWKEFISAFVE